MATAVSSRPVLRTRPLIGLLLGIVVVSAVGLAPLNFQSYGIVLQIYVLAGSAVAWNVIGGYAGQLSLGHVASFGLGAYTVAWLTAEFDASLLISLPAAMAVSCLTSVVLLPCFRARGAYFAILTLAFASILGQLAREYAPNANSGLLFSSFPATSRAPLQLLTVGIVGSLVIVFLMNRSNLGKAMRAVRQDLDGARAVGVDDFRIRAAALMVASLLNGYFGGVYAISLGFIDPETAFSLHWTITPVLAAILGGTGTLFGPVAGAAVWIGISELITAGGLSGGIPLALQGLALLLITVLLPRGLVGVLQSVGRRWRRDEDDPGPSSPDGPKDPRPEAELEESVR